MPVYEGESIKRIDLARRRNLLKSLAFTYFCKGYQLIPVKGYHPTDPDEAKAPLLRRGEIEYEIGVKKRDVSMRALKMVLRNESSAIGIAGANSGFVIVDIDAPMVEALGDKLFEMFPRDKVYAEYTGRGGIHVFLAIDVDDEKKICWRGVKGFVDNKTKGMAVVYPSWLRTDSPLAIYTYDKVSEVNLWETDAFSRYIDAIARLRRMALELKSRSEGGVEEPEESPESGVGEAIYVGVPIEVASLVSTLDTDELLTYAWLVAEDMGCGQCMGYYFERLLRREPIVMNNVDYPFSGNTRGLHAVFEKELFFFLRMLGATDDHLEDVCNRIRYRIVVCVEGTCVERDYEPRTSPCRSAERPESIAYKGLCPVRMANAIHGRYVDPYCCSTPCKRLSWYIESRLDRLIEILELVMSRRMKGCDSVATG